jgi:L,D-transpeptidase ErfK/SrfK
MNKLVSALFALALLVGGIFSAQAESKYYGGHLCAYEGFKCVKVKRGDSWKKLFPDKQKREIVKRLNRTNMSVAYRRWIVIPTDMTNISHMDLSPFPDYIKPNGEKRVIVNLSLHAFGAYNEYGYLVHWGPVSGGKGWCPDINRACNSAVGEFRITHKKGAACISNRFPIETSGGAPMPYCMFYYRGFALHASTLPGFHASHGCLRLFKDDALWLNRQFLDVGTQVVVTR